MDGIDIATLSPAELRARVGVIFQDFVRFHFTVADNIGVGWLPEMGNQAAIERAAAAAGVDEVDRGPARRLRADARPLVRRRTSCRSDSGSASRCRAPSCGARRC